MTGYSPRWLREVVRHYNEEGAAALADQRHANAGAAPLLDGSGQQALAAALQKPPAGGGRWSGRQVALWIARRLDRLAGSIAPDLGWAYPRRLGYTPQVPRPRQAEAADAAAQAASRRFTETAGGRRFGEAPRAFQKTSTKRLKKSADQRPIGRPRSGRSTSTGPALGGTPFRLPPAVAKLRREA